MSKTYNFSLFIFRRDLRLNDNTGLIEALKQSKQVLLCFIFDPEQVSETNAYRSTNALQFMLESLQDLAQEIITKKGTLYCFHGKPIKIIEELLKHLLIDALFINHDYTPFSRQRDAQLEDLCKRQKCPFHAYHDLLLIDPTTFFNKQKKPYTIFTPFFKAARQLPVMQPRALPAHTFYTGAVSLKTINLAHELTARGEILTTTNSHLASHGGRKQSALILKNLTHYKDYGKTHDVPALPTTRLSAYLKFGTHSIREVLHALQDSLGFEHPLIRQLYWRDFFTSITWHFSYVFGSAYRQEYNALSWDSSRKDFEAWCTGTTGFPIVDAGMQELVQTGFMHNRVRMIVASFLTKDLHSNWQWGEKFFAQHLIDYDPAVNNGNWQWVASTGCDAQPYFRIFNPWLQQKKFDPECIYIKKWLPGLRASTAKEIHGHATKHLQGYPPPMVNHTKEQRIALQRYKNIKKIKFNEL